MQGLDHASYQVHLWETTTRSRAFGIYKILVQLSELGLVCLNLSGPDCITDIAERVA